MNTNNHIPFGLEEIAAMSIEAVYVIDFLKREFLYVANSDLFLCGHSVEEAMLLGYDFYSKITHPADLPLLAEMHHAILLRLCSMTDSGNLNYFSFSVRMGNKSKYLMSFHKIKPLFVDGHIRYGLCTVVNTALATSGNLRTHHIDGVDDEEYLFTGTWQKIATLHLSQREREILRLAYRGKIGSKAADILHISNNTLRNDQAQLCKKLNVHSMTQALIYASTHQINFWDNQHDHNLKQEGKPVRRRIRHLITPDMMLRIQEGLHHGLHVNVIAEQEHISEGAIRYHIGKGKLQKAIKNS